MLQAMVPVNLVKPYLDKHLETCDKKDFAKRASLGERGLHRILTEQATVKWTTADRIFCAIGDPFIWHTDPRLRAIYESIAPEGKSIPDGLCAQGHSREAFGYRDKNRKLCCRECNRIRTRARWLANKDEYNRRKREWRARKKAV